LIQAKAAAMAHLQMRYREGAKDAKLREKKGKI
jgi:hypothetical protein